MERWRDGEMEVRRDRGTERQREEEIDGEYGMTSVAPFPRRSFSLSLCPSVSPSLLPRVCGGQAFRLADELAEAYNLASKSKSSPHGQIRLCESNYRRLPSS